MLKQIEGNGCEKEGRDALTERDTKIFSCERVKRHAAKLGAPADQVRVVVRRASCYTFELVESLLPICHWV